MPELLVRSQVLVFTMLLLAGFLGIIAHRFSIFSGPSMNTQHYSGVSNASGAIALDNDHFVIADDEDNFLRIFAKDITDQAVQTISLRTVFNEQIEDGEDHEIDLEGVAMIDQVYFWMGSHSTSRKGKPRPDRHRLLALHLKPNAEGGFTPLKVGSIYTSLIHDLKSDERFDRYDFAKAEKTAPKDLGGLSIEGLAATPEKELLIGFRNPLAGGIAVGDVLVQGRALVIPLLNPFEVTAGQPARFGNAIELDLDGFGIRDIVWYREQQYLIVAGPYDYNKKYPQKSRLYLWNRAANNVTLLPKADLQNLNVEAAFFFPDQPNTVQLLSDDGDAAGFHRAWLEL